MATEREFKLVGSFQDNITAKLKRINKDLTDLTKTYEKMGQRMRPVAKEMGNIAAAAERASSAVKMQRNAFDSNISSLRAYRNEMGKAVASSRKLASIKPPKPMPMSSPGGGGGGGGGRGGRGGGAGMIAAGVVGERMSDKGMGFGATMLAMTGAGLAVNLMTAGFNKITSAARGFISAGSQAEQATIQMAGTLQTLGKVGDFAKSSMLAEKMMGDLSKVAAALPGATGDYLSVLQQTLDDQIEAFGSVEAVQKNLSGFDPKTGKKLAGGMEQSFTALFGMTAQIAGMAPQIAAMDLNQLRASPKSVDRNIQIFTRNPTLKKFYLEELKKNGGKWFDALNAAMQKAITPQQVEALKQSYDSALQSLITTFTDPYSGIFGYAKKIKVAMGQSGEETVSVMSMLGRVMRQINGILESLLGMTGSDFLIKGIIGLLFEVEVYLYAARKWMEYFSKKGIMGIGKLGEIIGNIGTRIATRIIEAIANFDYHALFSAIDEFFLGLIRGIRKGLADTNWGKIMSGVTNALDGFLGTVSGLMVTLTMAVLAANKKIAGASLMDAGAALLGKGKGLEGFFKGAKGVQGPMPTAAGTKGMMAGGFLKDSIAQLRTGFSTVGKSLKYGAQEVRVGFQLMKMGQFGTAIKGVLTPMRSFGGALAKGVKSMGKLGGIATAVFAVFDVIMNMMSGKDIWESMASAAGPVIGSILGFALGGPIGAIIGGFLGDLVMQWQPAVDFMEGFFRGIGEVFGAIGITLGPIIESVGSIFMDLLSAGWSLISMFNPFENAINGITGEIGMMKAIVIAIKVILWPIVGAFQLLEQVLNVLVLAFKGLKAALLGARLGLSKLNPFANKDAQKRLEGEFVQAVKEAENAQGSFARSWNRHSQYYTTNLEKATQVTKEFSAAAEEAGSSFKNNAKFVDESGKSWGWAMLNGKEVMVEWGSVAGTSLNALQDGVSGATQSLAEYSAKTKSLIDQGKASGLTPSQSDLDWYNKQMGKPGAQAPAAAPPAAPAVPTVAQLAPEAIAALQTTQTNTGTTSTHASTIAMQGAATNVKLDAGNQATLAQTTQALSIGGRTIGALVAISNKLTPLTAMQTSMSAMAMSMMDLQSFVKTGVVKVKMEGGLFGPMGAASAEEKAIGGTAARFGLTKTSGFRPGDPGWHGVGRAADFSNSTGPTKEMMAFAQYLSATVGQNLKELIYTPLGYGIKNGQMVPPYARQGHYNHVHVAWNQGNTQPLLDEMRYAGNNTLGIANSGEFIANQNQTALLANALNKQNGHTFNISVNATGDGNEVANQVAAAVLNAIRQAESSTIA